MDGARSEYLPGGPKIIVTPLAVSYGNLQLFASLVFLTLDAADSFYAPFTSASQSHSTTRLPSLRICADSMSCRQFFSHHLRRRQLSCVGVVTYVSWMLFLRKRKLLIKGLKKKLNKTVKMLQTQNELNNPRQNERFDISAMCKLVKSLAGIIKMTVFSETF